MRFEAIHDNGPEGLNIEELKNLARSQPKVEPTSLDGQTTHVQNRGNFYRRFIEMKAFYEGVATDVQIIYIRTVKERFGVDLMDFYAQYPQLCSDICDAVEAKEPYDRLVTGRSKLVELESAEAIPPGSAGDLDAATEHPLGIEAIGMYYWDRINPLLERAYTLFEPITLNAPYLMS